MGLYGVLDLSAGYALLPISHCWHSVVYLRLGRRVGTVGSPGTLIVSPYHLRIQYLAACLQYYWRFNSYSSDFPHHPPSSPPPKGFRLFSRISTISDFSTVSACHVVSDADDLLFSLSTLPLSLPNNPISPLPRTRTPLLIPSYPPETGNLQPSLPPTAATLCLSSPEFHPLTNPMAAWTQQLRIPLNETHYSS